MKKLVHFIFGVPLSKIRRIIYWIVFLLFFLFALGCMSVRMTVANGAQVDQAFIFAAIVCLYFGACLIVDAVIGPRGGDVVGEKPKKKAYKRWSFWILIIMMLWIVIGIGAAIAQVSGYGPGAQGGPLLQQLMAQSGIKESSYYTAESYSSDGPSGTITSNPASSRVQVSINGDEQPLVFSPPASYTVSWNIDPQLFSEATCTMGGVSLTTASGTEQETIPYNNSSQAIFEMYQVRCVQGTDSNQIVDADVVEAWILPGGQ